jgi:hypothetical protein
MLRDFSSGRLSQSALIVVVNVLLLTCAAGAEDQGEKQDNQWHFSIMPYAWVPSVSGKLKFGLPAGWGGGDVNVSSNDYLSNLRFVGMLDLQAEKGRWSLLVDLMYVDFSNDDRKASFFTNHPGGGLNVGAETGLSAFVGEAVLGYAVYRTKTVDFNVVAGVRYADIEGKVTLDVAGPLPAGFRSAKVSERDYFIDPIVGIRGRFELGKKWFIPYYFDIGGFGASTNFTSQGFAGIGYHFTDLFSMVLGYRYLYYDFGDKFVKDITLHGAVLGFAFTF